MTRTSLPRGSANQLRLTASAIAAVLDAFPVAFLVVAASGDIEFANRELERLTGWRVSDIVGRSVRTVVPSANRGRRADGSSFDAEVLVSPALLDHGGATVWVIRDESERRRTAAELFDRATHDALTGLANRSLFADRLGHALAGLDRHPGALAVLFVDLDGFKLVNDRRGHASGDAVLRAVARSLLETVRPVDTVARLGGDEFVVLCESIGADATYELADRLRVAVRDATAHELGAGASGLVVTASVGVVLSTGRASVASLLDASDRAMYDAKRAGGDRVCVAGHGSHGLGDEESNDPSRAGPPPSSIGA